MRLNGRLRRNGRLATKKRSRRPPPTSSNKRPSSAILSVEMPSLRTALRATIVAVLLAVSAAGQTPAAPKPMSLIDLANLQRIAGYHLSPDGRTLVYGLSVPDWK